jgi:UDP-N-acetylglucosamine transferase subunit ALG13
MIFVTVGTQLPFDRLVRTVDAWSGKTGADVFAQIGPGEYAPQHLKWTRTLPADECNDRIRGAQAVVAHAGMGSILTALQYGKPIVVMPRRAGLGEHRNDHQVMTAKHFQEQGRIRVAFDEADLVRQLDEIATIKATARIAGTASPALIAALRQFVHKVAADAGGDAAAGLNAPPVAGASVARV